VPTKLVGNPYNNGLVEARFINYYECAECGYEWEDEYECEVDDDCSDCGARHMSPVRTEDHPEYDPQEVFVVIKMYEGNFSQVEVFKNDPDPDNVFECDEHWDNGEKVFSININEGKVWT